MVEKAAKVSISLPSELAEVCAHVGQRAGQARSYPKVAKRAQAVLEPARTGAVISVPAAVLVEVHRGSRQDAAVDWMHRRIAEVVPTGRAIACRGGQAPR